MAFSPLENFRNFLSSRPPLVLFIVCIGMVAIAFISYAYYIKYHDVYNPEANAKLNKFVDNVTSLNLCTKLSNESWSLGHSVKPQNFTLDQVLHTLHPEDEDGTKYEKLSFLVSVGVSFLSKAHLFPKPITGFVSSFPAYLFGISGKDENRSVAIEMIPNTPMSLQCTTEVCLAEYKMCATVMAPTNLIPYARQQHNKQCSFEKDNSTSAFIAWLDVTAPPKGHQDHSVAQCKSSILLKAERVKEHFTVMLTLEKRSVANMHLMHSSYFLFVVVVTILLFGIITGGGERKYSRNQGNHYSAMTSGIP